MERLTHIDNKGWYIDDQSVAFDERRRGKEINRLAEYEDTGLTPDEIKGLRNELCLLCGKYKNAYLGACNECRWK